MPPRNNKRRRQRRKQNREQNRKQNRKQNRRQNREQSVDQARPQGVGGSNTDTPARPKDAVTKPTTLSDNPLKDAVTKPTTPKTEELSQSFGSFTAAARGNTPPEYKKPKNKEQLFARQKAAASLMEAMEMSPGNAREDAIARASMQAQQAGVTASRIDDFIENPAYAKAAKIQQVRAAGEKAVAAGRQPYQQPDIGRYDDGRPQLSSRKYAEKAAEARAAGFTGVQGSGGLAELYQMQSDRASKRVAPGTFTALSKPAKRIAPDSRIESRLASQVAKGEITPEGAYDKFQEIKDNKMRYNNPRRAALMKQRELAEMNYRIKRGLPLPEKKKGKIEGQLSKADRERAIRQANRSSGIRRKAGGSMDERTFPTQYR